MGLDPLSGLISGGIGLLGGLLGGKGQTASHQPFTTKEPETAAQYELFSMLQNRFGSPYPAAIMKNPSPHWLQVMGPAMGLVPMNREKQASSDFFANNSGSLPNVNNVRFGYGGGNFGQNPGGYF